MEGRKRWVGVLAVVGGVVLLGGVYWTYWEERLGAETQLANEDGLFLSDGTPIVLPAELNGGGVDYFGNEATGDLDQDGRDDRAFLVTQQPGGSGTFYYVIVMRSTVDGYVATNAVLLGDRIAPQSTSIDGAQLVVSYATRDLDEPMTAQPTVGTSKTLTLKDGVLTEYGE